MNLLSGLEQRQGWFKAVYLVELFSASMLFITGLILFRHLGILGK